jgi:hypothetical protein
MEVLTLKVHLDCYSYQFTRANHTVNETAARKLLVSLFEGFRSYASNAAIKQITVEFHGANPSQKVWAFTITRDWNALRRRYSFVVVVSVTGPDLAQGGSLGDTR